MTDLVHNIAEEGAYQPRRCAVMCLEAIQVLDGEHVQPVTVRKVSQHPRNSRRV